MCSRPCRHPSCVLGLLAACAAIAWSTTALAVDADPSNYTSVVPTLQPGDTLNLAAGTYTDGLAISNLNGTESTPITITGPPSGPAAIIQAPTSGCCNDVEITQSSYLVLAHLTIDSAGGDGIFGLSAKDGTSNLVHHVTVEDCTFIGQGAGQQTVGISTKTPTWGWVIRRNVIDGAGTGLYLGNSDGSDPFVGGLIEYNLVKNTVGYDMEIKFQNPRPAVAGMPTGDSTTIVRHNVFIKNDQPSPDGDRPNVLVGGFPASGAGANDLYQIYGNLFFHNPRESLLQVSGRVSIHDNVLVDAASAAITLRDHDLPLELAHVYNNTVYTGADGIAFGNAAPQGDAVIGNLVFSPNPISGAITTQSQNLTAAVADAANYVNAPSMTLGAMDFYPLVGQCQGAAFDLAAVSTDSDYDRDFNGTPKGGFTFRGAYAGEGTNPGWPLDDGVKGDVPGNGGNGGSGGSGTGGNGTGAGGNGAGASGGTSALPNGETPAEHSGCGCRVPASPTGPAWPAWAAIAALAVLGARYSGRRSCSSSRKRSASVRTRLASHGFMSSSSASSTSRVTT